MVIDDSNDETKARLRDMRSGTEWRTLTSRAQEDVTKCLSSLLANALDTDMERTDAVRTQERIRTLNEVFGLDGGDSFIDAAIADL